MLLFGWVCFVWFMGVCLIVVVSVFGFAFIVCCCLVCGLFFLVFCFEVVVCMLVVVVFRLVVDCIDGYCIRYL